MAANETGRVRYTNQRRLLQVRPDGRPVFAPAEDGATCPLCGDLVMWGATHCPGCGARL